jgi:hypothetical protein
LKAADFQGVRFVLARRRIEDSPLARKPVVAKRGMMGSVEDVDTCAELVVVEFETGVLLCEPEELKPWA